jgi:hypothetical protein
LFIGISALLSLHRERDLPAEESRVEAIKSLGNKARKPPGNRMVEDGRQEALATDVISENEGPRAQACGLE